MIAVFKLDKKEVGQILHNGKVFSVSKIDYSDSDQKYFSEMVNYYKKNAFEIFDTTSTPGSLISCKLGESMVKTFLICQRGMPGFDIEITNPLKAYSINASGVVS